MADCSDYEPATLEHIPQTRTVIFIVSTYGEGEPSDNMTDCLNWLQTRKSDSSLSQLRYSALGLGNSNYKYYNAVVEALVTRLNALGSEAILPLARADDAKGETEEHYLEWKESLFSDCFKAKLGFEEHDPVYEPSLEVFFEPDAASGDDVTVVEPWSQTSNRKTMRTMTPTHALPLKAARELFDQSGEGRNCVHMEIDLSSHPGVKYKTGDHLGVWPMNPLPEVDTLLSQLGLAEKQHSVINVENKHAEDKLKIPSRTTLIALFGHHLEVSAPVSRETVAALIQFSPSAAAKDTLSRLSSDKSAYAQLLTTKYVTLGRLLSLASGGASAAWSHLPLSFVIEALPAMQPRYYSISSSSVVQPRQVAITAVVADKTLSGSHERISGLCTNYLQAAKSSLSGVHQDQTTDTRYPLLQGPLRIFAHVRKSTFKLPALASQPIIMVAAGTGLAPFRAFLHERARLAKMGRPVGRTILFFGCRNPSQDFIYRDELLSLQETLGSDIFTLVTAFSRPDNGETKAYVQHRVKDYAEEVMDLLVNGNANFYICGSAAMARDVAKVLGSEIRERQGWDEGKLSAFLESQRKTRRWQQDVWG